MSAAMATTRKDGPVSWPRTMLRPAAGAAVLAGLALSAAACPQSGSGPQPPPPCAAGKYLRCSSDADCALAATEGELSSYAFRHWPPLCVFGMCQLGDTHRCATDEECDDVAEIDGYPAPCRPLPDGSGGFCDRPFQRMRVAEYLGYTVSCSHPMDTSTRSWFNCYPEGDRDFTRYRCLYSFCVPTEDYAPCLPSSPSDSENFGIGGCRNSPAAHGGTGPPLVVLALLVAAWGRRRTRCCPDAGAC